MGKQLMERKDLSFSQHKHNRKYTDQNERLKEDKLREQNERWQTAMRMRQESYTYVSNNESKRLRAVESMSAKREEEFSHRKLVKDHLS